MQTKFYIVRLHNVLKNHFNFTNDIDYSIHNSKQEAVDYVRSINKSIYIVDAELDDYSSRRVVDDAISELRQSNIPIYSSYKYARVICVDTNKVCEVSQLVEIAKTHTRDYVKMVMRTNEMNLFKSISDKYSELYYLTENEVFECISKYESDEEWVFRKDVLPNVRNIFTDKTFFSTVNMYNDLKNKVVILGQYYRKDGITYEVINPELEHGSVEFKGFDDTGVVMLRQRTGKDKYLYDTVIVSTIDYVLNNLKLVDDI